ncbi:hypothetical protein RM780_09750 [Streptomyces sp. DSM 44917]|uniref:Glyoxalase-like domain-containing protein n=1 Tax=Streptomyces boetiae TaxID=3075541 RepID=A0ABU2L6U5_9ACTN|nr:hypothetical protein [Streptomyces sp. DSM 44917]MDT0307245.1 hypothetical protein [Streptomyces sp. DSM 44917]
MTSKPRLIRVHLTAHFATREEALAWFDELRRQGAVPATAELYVPDALDKDGHGLTGQDLIVRPGGDRPWGRVRDQRPPRRRRRTTD